MAYDAFLTLDGIKGEATTKGKEGWIEISSFSFGADHPVSVSASGRSTGKSNVHDMKVTKVVDASSPKLFIACVTGQNFKSGKVYVRKAGGTNPVEYLKYEFEGLLITGFDIEASGGDENPEESISINFTKIDLTYTGQKPDGSAGGAVPVSYDLKTGLTS